MLDINKARQVMLPGFMEENRRLVSDLLQAHRIEFFALCATLSICSLYGLISFRPYANPPNSQMGVLVTRFIKIAAKQKFDGYFLVIQRRCWNFFCVI